MGEDNPLGILIDWQWLTALAVILVALSHVLFWWLRSRSCAHRAVTYFAFLLGGLSLVSAVYQSESERAEWIKPQIEERMNASGDWLLTALASQRRYYCESDFRRSEYSPPDFDKIVRDQRRACEITKGVELRVSNVLSDGGQISLPEFRDRAFRRSPDQETVKMAQDAAQRYNEQTRQLRVLDEVIGSSTFEKTLTYFGPYALILAFSLGLGSIAFPAGSSSNCLSKWPAWLRRRR